MADLADPTQLSIDDGKKDIAVDPETSSVDLDAAKLAGSHTLFCTSTLSSRQFPEASLMTVAAPAIRCEWCALALAHQPICGGRARHLHQMSRWVPCVL
jgi:hypothetical protein